MHGSQPIKLPIVPVVPKRVAIALLMTVDMPLSVMDQAGAKLAELLRPYRPQVIVTAATLGIPVAWATAKALGLDTIIVLHKTPKTHLADALVEPLSSMTTKGSQQFHLDLARVPKIADRDVAFVDDVVSTGGSAAAALRLINTARGRVCAVGALLVEGDGWKEKLTQYTDQLVSLGSIPVFQPATGGVGWVKGN